MTATIRPESREGTTWYTVYVGETPIISAHYMSEAVIAAMMAGYTVEER